MGIDQGNSKFTKIASLPVHKKEARYMGKRDKPERKWLRDRLLQGGRGAVAFMRQERVHVVLSQKQRPLY
jgi:hypothetical protein